MNSNFSARLFGEGDPEPGTKHLCCEPGCGVEFLVSKGEEAFLISRGLSLPRRCRECRARRRREHEQAGVH